MPDFPNARILIIATHGFEQSELEVPRDELRNAGATVDVASPDGRQIRGWRTNDWGRPDPANLIIAHANADDHHALVIPAGVLKSDILRVDVDAMRVVNEFLVPGKIVAAVRHGP